MIRWIYRYKPSSISGSTWTREICALSSSLLPNSNENCIIGVIQRYGMAVRARANFLQRNAAYYQAFRFRGSSKVRFETTQAHLASSTTSRL